MKILIIRNYPSYMDVENNTYNIQEVGLAKALVRKGNTCDIVFWTNKEEKIVTLSVENYGMIRVFYRHGKTALKNTIYVGCEKLFEKYDILQTAEYNQIQSWILAKRYPCKIVVYHGPYYSTFNKRYNLMCAIFDKFFVKRYIKLNTHFITKSELATDFLESKGLNENNITTVGVGIDTELLSAKKEICKDALYLKMQSDSSLKILYVGRFEERRNIPFILEVFSSVLRRRNNVMLYMVGNGDKNYVDMCWEYAEKLGIRNKIVYQEKMEQKYLSLIYSMADFFLLPTEYEIFGMVLLEAMYYQNVVLTTKNGGSDTIIENEKNGFVFMNKDVERWANRIIEISSDYGQMKQIEYEAYTYIRDNFTWDSLTDRFIEQYENTIRGR